jgi:hypothetical protein
LDGTNWKELALLHKNTPVVRKLFNLLELVAKRSKPGNSAPINLDLDVPLLDAFDSLELTFLLNTQVELGYIEQVHGPTSARLKAKGWEQIQAASLNGIEGKCFVAMSFDNDLKKPVWEDAIRPAVVDDCRMKAVRMDLIPHNGQIVDKIITEIRTCQFMVADLTGHKAGVYFEAGFAKGLGRDVIWTCREDDFKKIHFDIAQFNHIVLERPSRLKNEVSRQNQGDYSGGSLTKIYLKRCLSSGCRLADRRAYAYN